MEKDLSGFTGDIKFSAALGAIVAGHPSSVPALLVAAKPGTGKTVALRKYHQTHPHDAALIEFDYHPEDKGYCAKISFLGESVYLRPRDGLPVLPEFATMASVFLIDDINPEQIYIDSILAANVDAFNGVTCINFYRAIFAQAVALVKSRGAGKVVMTGTRAKTLLAEPDDSSVAKYVFN